MWTHSAPLSGRRHSVVASPIICAAKLLRAIRSRPPLPAPTLYIHLRSSPLPTSPSFAEHTSHFESGVHHVFRSQEALCGLLQRFQAIQQTFLDHPQLPLQPQIIEFILHSSGDNIERTIASQVRSPAQWLQAKLSDSFLPASEHDFQRQPNATTTLWRRSGGWYHVCHKHDLQPGNS